MCQRYLWRVWPLYECLTFHPTHYDSIRNQRTNKLEMTTSPKKKKLLIVELSLSFINRPKSFDIEFFTDSLDIVLSIQLIVVIIKFVFSLIVTSKVSNKILFDQMVWYMYSVEEVLRKGSIYRDGRSSWTDSSHWFPTPTLNLWPIKPVEVTLWKSYRDLCRLI